MVRLPAGAIRGRPASAAAGAAFKGIPFAQPPVGDLRWREPAPVKPWTGIRDAGAYSAPCAQIPAGWNDQVAARGSEDCLYLNVWTPEWPVRSRRAVMVWIHGGANMGGSSMGSAGIEPSFDGENLARRGVVVVTINYRLGMFGFFAHPELTAESPRHASGNYGLMDQIAALRWVRENIAKFGGDPASVTIFGQSAGALNVGLLMTSPLARGLFHRTIQQSGTVIIMGMGTPPLAEAEQIGVKLAAKMNAPASGAMKFLRTLATADVLKASPPYGVRGPLRTQPNLDGYVLPRSPGEVFRTGGEAPVPAIIGSNGREMSFSGEPDALKTAITDFYGTQAPVILRLYGLDGSKVPAPYPPCGATAAQVWTDLAFRCPAVAVTGWHSAHGQTYQYEFTRGTEPEGSRHSLELRYIFGLRDEQKLAPVDEQISSLMQRYWTNFARSGDPNGAGLPHWPDSGPEKREYLELGDDGPVVKAGLRREFCDVFRDAITRKLSR